MRTFHRKIAIYKWYTIIALSSFLLTIIIEGPLRYALYIINKEPLIYLPKILLISILLPSLFQMRTNKLILLISILLFAYSIIGYLYMHSIMQVVFGLWIVAPFLCGIQSEPILFNNRKIFMIIIASIYIVALIGILVDHYFDMPWEGFIYSLYASEIEATRKWTTMGFSRLSGFSRASFDVAIQILFLSTYLVIYTKNKLLKASLWIVGLTAIVMTTQKGAVLSAIFTTLFLLSYTRIRAFYWKLFIFGCGLVVIASPILSVTYGSNLNLNSTLSRFLLRSFEDRMLLTWPDAFKLLHDNGSLIIGRGIGGIGIPQRYFEVLSYNPGDNFFIYLFITYGLLSIPLIMAFATMSSRLNFKSDIDCRFSFCIALNVLLLGITTNIVESPIVALFFGFICRFTFVQWYNKRWIGGSQRALDRDKFAYSPPSPSNPLSLVQLHTGNGSLQWDAAEMVARS